MTNDLRGFQGTPESCTCSVLGVNNNTAVISKRGTGSYTVLDQDGMSHTWIIPDLYYCATTPYQVISPQHLDSCWKRDKIGRFSEATSSDGTLIEWSRNDGRKYYKIINHNPRSNVPIIHTEPTINKFNQYIKSYKLHSNTDGKLLACAAAHMIPSSDDEPIHDEKHNIHALPSNEGANDNAINTQTGEGISKIL
jgi:hypothetical protein